MVPLPRFEIRRKTNRLTRKTHYWVVLIAENGETLSTSEMLSGEGAAMTNIESQMQNVPNCDIYRDY